MSRPLGRALIVPVLAALAVLAPATAAHAHARLVDSDPADGARLRAVPAAVTLVFDDPIAAGMARAELAGPGGRREVAPTVRGSRVSVPLPRGDALAGVLGSAPGDTDLTVTYRVVSADGHPVSGQIRITVPIAAPSPATPTAKAGTSTGRTPSGAASSAPRVGVGSAAVAPTEPTAVAATGATSKNDDKPSTAEPEVTFGESIPGWAVIALAVLGAAAAALVLVRKRPRGPQGPPS